MPPSRRRPAASRRPRVAGLNARPNEQSSPTTTEPPAGLEPQRRPDQRPPAGQPPRPGGAAPIRIRRLTGERGDDGTRGLTEAPAVAPDTVEPAAVAQDAQDAPVVAVVAAAPASAPAAADDLPGDAEDGAHAEPVAGEESVEPEPQAEPAAAGTGAPTTRRGGRGTALLRGDLALPVALVLLAAVLAGLGVWWRAEAGQIRSSGAVQNRALVDAGQTSEVNGQVSAAVEKVFSYSYTDTASTEKAAQTLLRGRALDQYNQLFGRIKQDAPTQKLVVTVKVVFSGVRVLDGDRAVVLLFIDQTATRADLNQTSAGAAQLTANAERRSGQWVITDFSMS